MRSLVLAMLEVYYKVWLHMWWHHFEMQCIQTR